MCSSLSGPRIGCVHRSALRIQLLCTPVANCGASVHTRISALCSLPFIKKDLFILFELGVFICVACKMRLVYKSFCRASPSCLTTLPAGLAKSARLVNYFRNESPFPRLHNFHFNLGLGWVRIVQERVAVPSLIIFFFFLFRLLRRLDQTLITSRSLVGTNSYGASNVSTLHCVEFISVAFHRHPARFTLDSPPQ